MKYKIEIGAALVGTRWRALTLLWKEYTQAFTAWKVSKYGVISGLNTGKYGQEITPYLETFHALRYTDTDESYTALYFLLLYNYTHYVVILILLRNYTYYYLILVTPTEDHCFVLKQDDPKMFNLEAACSILCKKERPKLWKHVTAFFVFHLKASSESYMTTRLRQTAV